MTLDPPVEAVYSSPYYRCLQTITPFVELQQQKQANGDVLGGDAPSATTIIRPEHGLCEWFGSAPFEHPGPASPAVLKPLFPAFDESYVSAQHPPKRGETLAQLQARLTATVQSIIDRCDAEDRRAVVLCTHAAVVITLGRIITGCFPETVDTDDFRAFTCGVSVFRRKLVSQDGHGPHATRNSTGEEPGPDVVVGGWTCEANSDCSFLTNGEERGWYVLSQKQSIDCLRPALTMQFPAPGSLWEMKSFQTQAPCPMRHLGLSYSTMSLGRLNLSTSRVDTQVSRKYQGDVIVFATEASNTMYRVLRIDQYIQLLGT